MASPEARARAEIDRLLTAAGWHVCDFKAASLHAARGAAIREFELQAGHGTADYLLSINGKAAGGVETTAALMRATHAAAAASTWTSGVGMRMAGAMDCSLARTTGSDASACTWSRAR